MKAHVTELAHLNVFIADRLGATAACDHRRRARPIRPMKLVATFVELIPAMFASFGTVRFHERVDADLTNKIVIASLWFFCCGLLAR